jgi:S-adenosylmethionine:tRNA ribosyltransferase-isomerase
MFSFDLPQTRIAKKPIENREDAKLMVVHRSTGEIEHKLVSDLGDYFQEGDVIATNNKKKLNAKHNIK